jgi:tRNA (guanosine-2'-O-)-methyltransferase
MGTQRYLSWSTFERAADAADAAREDGFTVIGLELADDAVPLHQMSSGPDVCVALGNEDHGLTASALAACDAVAFLPLTGRVGSLNVATAAAVAVYELRRQGWT